MISWRNYIAAVMLMLALTFLLMGSNLFKDYWNDFSVNEYTIDTASRDSEANPIWYDDAGNSTTGAAVFVGAPRSSYRQAVVDWAAYSRHYLSEFSTLQSYQTRPDNHTVPDLLILDATSLNWSSKDDADYLMSCVEQGTNIVFCTLPELDAVRNSSVLRDLLGIRGITARERAVDGIFLYPGFLLGGGKIYAMPEDAEEKDEPIEFPGTTDSTGRPVCDWFRLGPGTKVYMSGIPEEESVPSSDYPPLMWRRSLASAYVFAVNGTFMEGAEGIGILSAIMSEARPYAVYPVANAQNMVLIDYPVLADENRAEMQRLYSRSVMDVYQEIVWGNVQKVSHEFGYKVSCMMTPELDYSDDIAPNAKQLEYYLKLFNEAAAEAGLSLVGVSDTPLEQKIQEDQEFFSEITDYEFSAVYSGDLSDTDVEAGLQSALLQSVDTVVRDYSDDQTPLSLLNNQATVQASVDTEFACTFKQDYLIRCMMTALGYTSISFDMSRVAYPESDGDAWEKLSVDFASAAAGYGQTYPHIEKTTVSESSLRVQAMLTTKYTSSRENDCIVLETEGTAQTNWFILRTHNERIDRVEGGSFAELEEDAFLVEVDEAKVTIHLAPNNDSRANQSANVGKD
ncbi:MAG: DUF2194 domain-containing protein [Clostridia bacterium]|nr:DUF2194 domain-containing protein [Clostridia bacterium]